MDVIDVSDVQGIVLRGYGQLTAACFVLLTIEDGARARAWLSDLVESGALTPAHGAVPDECANVAFTYPGLKALGLQEADSSEFPDQFRYGMSGYAEVLGDTGESAPERWQWGGPPPAELVHVALLLYAKDEPACDLLYARHHARFTASGLREITKVVCLQLPRRKEHFGFRDGIGQPAVRNDNPPEERVGVLEAPPPTARGDFNLIAPGEFLLGYSNEDGRAIPPSPGIERAQDPGDVLPLRDDGRKDFGGNGSYLVVRQLEQRVRQFWAFLASSYPTWEDRIRAASKMVGRWPNGAPMITEPATAPDLSQDRDDDDFLYATDGDTDGVRCPIGSHIRRTNPRDALITDDPDGSLASGRRRRIIRRGRAYGSPVHESLDPRKMLEAPGSDGDVGLMFLCFNAKIGDQFEFLQQTWVNNPKFGGLYDDKDPIIGDHAASGGQFTIQTDAGPLSVTGLGRFVTVKGGAYFFMPGLRAVQYLASL